MSIATIAIRRNPFKCVYSKTNREYADILSKPRDSLGQTK